MAKRFLLTIAYEGAYFRGWQRQEASQEARMPSVSAALESAIRKAADTSDFSLHGSGRTDVGVHARAQTAHLEISTRLSLPTLQRAINSNLVEGVRILSIEPASEDFHAQRHVKQKTYRYFVLNRVGDGAITWPMLSRWTWLVPQKLNVARMQKAIGRLEGTHDFAAFQNVGTPVQHTVREIFSAECIHHPWENLGDFPWVPLGKAAQDLRLIEFRLCGKGFLKQMVRNIAGTLVEVGKGNLAEADIDQILASKSRAQGGPTAPAEGLFLDHVVY